MVGIHLDSQQRLGLAEAQLYQRHGSIEHPTVTADPTRHPMGQDRREHHHHYPGQLHSTYPDFSHYPSRYRGWRFNDKAQALNPKHVCPTTYQEIIQ